MATKTVQTRFSDDEIKSIQGAALRVWDEIAYDCLQATADDKGKDINAVTISRSQVIELALDAGRAEEMLMEHTKRDVTAEQRGDFLVRLRTADYQQLIKLVKPAFTYARYGM